MAELALALLPLCVSAIEHYTDAVTAFSRFRRFSSEAAKLISLLKIQRTIFRAANKRLLAECIGQDEAHEMTDDDDHPKWRDATLEAIIQQQVGDCGPAVIEAVKMIELELSRLERDCCEFKKVIDDNVGNERPKGRVWCRSIGKKAKFALSESHFQESIDRIRNLTQDYRSLINPLGGPRPTKAKVTLSDIVSRHTQADFSLVKRAASNLYENLGLACTKHTEHKTHFSLQPVPSRSKSQVRFSLAYRQLSLGSDHHMWLTIESMITAFVDKPVQSPFGSSAKRDTSSPPPTPGTTHGKRKRVVRFCSPTPSPEPQSKVADRKNNFDTTIVEGVSLQLVSIMPVLPNLSSHNNLCNRIKHACEQSASGSKLEHCIGYLENCAETKHLIYIDQRNKDMRVSSQQTKMTTLRELFSNAQKRKLDDVTFSAFERVQLAKNLAIAVLQFYETPWLNTSWCSDDIALLCKSRDPNSLSSISLTDPYLSVSVKAPIESISRASTFPNKTLIRNPIIFRLGVMMLELAFEAPLKSLQKPIDLHNTAVDTEYLTALRVRESASRLLGGVYAEVARKCVQCDFACGDDLNQASLQDSFYRDAVCKLGEIEEQLRMCHLGS